MVEVPTIDQFNALDSRESALEGRVVVLENVLGLLVGRVTSLETKAGMPQTVKDAFSTIAVWANSQ